VYTGGGEGAAAQEYEAQFEVLSICVCTCVKGAGGCGGLVGCVREVDSHLQGVNLIWYICQSKGMRVNRAAAQGRQALGHFGGSSLQSRVVGENRAAPQTQVGWVDSSSLPGGTSLQTKPRLVLSRFACCFGRYLPGKPPTTMLPGCFQPADTSTCFVGLSERAGADGAITRVPHGFTWPAVSWAPPL
jgi:hypothetical protein